MFLITRYDFEDARWFAEYVIEPCTPACFTGSVLEMENLGAKLHPVTINIPLSLSFDIFSIILHFFYKLELRFTCVLFTEILTTAAT